MNILAIDSSRKSFSLSLSKDNEIKTFQDTSESVSSESILVEIDNLVSKCEINPNQIDSVIFNSGPGSFTGVRVSSAIVQAIGYSNNCPVYGINSLNLDAYSIFKKHQIENLQIIKKAFGDQIFHGLIKINLNECIMEEPCTTMTLSDVKLLSDYTIATDSQDIINEEISNHILIDDYINSELLIEYYKTYCSLKESFDYKDALPSYAGHTI